MDKTELSNLLNKIFIPLGFKRKGNSWIKESNEITKIINLQKSGFSNRFYLNYGYIINSVPLERLKMHIIDGLDSPDIKENIRIKELLNLENDISPEGRYKDLKLILNERLLSNFLEITTEEELQNNLRIRPNLNNVSLLVKRYFNLPLEL